MERLVPVTKIIATLLVSICSIALVQPFMLACLWGIELLIMLAFGILQKQIKAISSLIVFAIILGVVQMLGGGSLDSAFVTAFRMLCMTMVFMMLLTTTKMQDLTAALVMQCKVPYEYAFMFTAALRFVPDFITESKAVQEAQACRGLSLEGGFLKRMKSYMSVVQPLMLKSLGRSETMALSLELRGFGSKHHNFAAKVAMQGVDYGIVAIMILGTAFAFYIR